MTPIPPADARLCLHTPLTLDPKPKSWAHVTKSWLYKGDLAYVLDYDVETGADVLVVPRVDILQRLSRSRPPQALLKLDDIYRELGQKAVEVKGDSFIFRSLSYHISGYHQFKTRNLSVSSISTMAELSTFRDYPHMSLHAVLDMYAKLEELRLERDDPVKVVQGQLKGSVGVIRSLDEDRSLATIVVQDTVGEVVLPTQYLRKHLSVGDQVGVVDGIHKGSVGWVTALLEKNLVIWDDRAQQELTVAPNCVAFHWNPQTLATIPPPTSSIELPSKLVQDPLYFLTGNQVTIVGSHVYKGYDGYIKNTLHNGSVVVETEAGLRDVVVDLHNVSKRDSSTLSPLSRNELLQSQLPLSVSTPLPTGTSVSPSSAWRHPSSNLNSVAGMTPMPDVAASDTTSPAWDPSSRTPLPISETITHPWMYSHKSDLKVLFELTRKDAPSSPTLIWRWGDFSRPKMLKVQNGDMEEEILESLVTYVLPSKEKDRVEGGVPFYCSEKTAFPDLLREATSVEEQILAQEAIDWNPVTFPPENPSSSGSSPAKSGVNHSHSRRANKRANVFAAQGHVPSARTRFAHHFGTSSVQTALSSENLPVNYGAYTAKKDGLKKGDTKAWTLSELKKEGLVVLEWDGQTDFPPPPRSVSRPIVDKEGRIIAALVGQPQDPSFSKAATSAYETIAREGNAAAFRREESIHRRGPYPAVHCGVVHAKGTTEPVDVNCRRHAAMVNRLLADPNIRRLASFASASFQAWAPRVCQYYRLQLDALWGRMPHLRRIFPRSIFPSATFNFGPNVWTYRHRDVMNCPFGWCAVQALGHFDAKKGGHLILWDLGLVVEFPAGSLILLPSACFSHSNVPVQSGDVRASFTQYCGGGLFRYVDHGFRTEKKHRADDLADYEKFCETKPDRWKMGLGLFSNFLITSASAFRLTYKDETSSQSCPSSLFSASVMQSNPRIAITGRFDVLEVEHVLDIVRALPFGDVVALAGTCTIFREIIKEHLLNKVHLLLAHFDLDGEFLDVLHETGAVISGSSALSVINPSTFQPGDLDLYVSWEYTQVLLDRLTNTYQMTIIPRPSVPKYEEHPGPISAVYTLQHGVHKVDIIESRNYAMMPIFSFHSTAVMNCITSTSLFCAYPHLTSTYRNLASWAFEPMVDEFIARRQAKLDKYAAYGYEAQWDLEAWEDMNNSESLYHANHQFSWRSAQDRHCLWFDFDEVNPSRAHRGPAWPWMLTY
ncbi:hypothetical protein H0H93_010125 [Arthromyces matolae]|nr:hypothetical protein H0H93_010125 [Arthromyces matolae]